MDINKSQKKLSKYRRIMMLREGLSFSDYFDDSVPYEVKPVPSTIPMEETESDYIGNSDIPTQSKDLFKGLWESDVNILKNGNTYWLDPDGKFHRAKIGHKPWAMDYLNNKNIPYDADDSYSTTPNEQGYVGAYRTMFMNNFVRVVVGNETIVTENPVKGVNNMQMRVLRDAAIESGLDLHVGKKRIDLDESKYVDKDGRSLFIEHMMPNDMEVFKTHLAQLFAYLQKELQLKTVPDVKLLSDEKNADKVLGKTAYYNPDEKLVVLYTTNRHQKDILRSFAHEIIHHWQHENEKLHEVNDEKKGTKDPQYAQNNPWLRQMEKQAYLLGNILFRDWEDKKKSEDRKSGNDGKSKKVKEQHGKGNVRYDSLTPIMKQQFPPSHAYRKNTEGPQEPDVRDVAREQTYSLGNEYPPKKMNYKG